MPNDQSYVGPGDYVLLCPICDMKVSPNVRKLAEHGVRRQSATGTCPGTGKEPRAAADTLRLFVSNLNYTREGFNDRFTVAQLLQIFRMQLANEWDFMPDQWDERQIKEALAGHPPRWADDEVPIYADGTGPEKGEGE